MFEIEHHEKLAIASQQRVKERKYWLNRLQGDLIRSSFPCDTLFKSPEETSRLFYQFEFDEKLSASLLRICNGNHYTLFIALAAGTVLLLDFYTGNRDIIISAPILRQKESSDFLNTILILRQTIYHEWSFKQFLMQMKQTVDQAIEHLNYPLEILLKQLQIQPVDDGFPLFDVAILLENIQPQEYLDPVRINIVLSFKEEQGRISGKIAYNKAIFQEKSVARIAEYLKNLLQDAIARPDQPLNQFYVLAGNERSRLLFDLNETGKEYAGSKLIQELFEDQVKKNPEFTALICEQETWTYRQLNQKANRLAHFLRNQGVGPESVVAFAGKRTGGMVIAALAIIKAGGAYMAIDAAYPEDRKIYMVKDSHPQLLLLVDKSFQDKTVLPESLEVLNLHDEKCFAGPDANPTIINKRNDIVYLIYTSGSTGRPKGILAKHHSLCHYVQAIQASIQVKSSDLYLHTASFAFSSSVRQMMLPLSYGAAIVIATRDDINNPVQLFILIKNKQVTIIDLVPSYWRNCCQELGQIEEKERQAILSNQLRLVLSASEPLISDIPEKWRYEFKHQAALKNMFGQTETTGIVCTYPIPDNKTGEVKVVTIGRPIANTRIYLLDKFMRPVPFGLPGELFVGGRGIARGYLNQVEISREKFLENPFVQKGDEESFLYRTGDQSRYNEDGTIEFIGRIDNQLKIRGFRVEPAEIEVVLSQHPKVRESIIVGKEVEKNEKQLIAFVIPEDDEQPLVSELRQYLLAKLPGYMVPNIFVTLLAFPLTSSKKIDRKALLKYKVKTDEKYVAPVKADEKTMAGIWAETLNMAKEIVGVHSNYFEIGGHSLNAISMISKVQRIFGVNISLVEVFKNPTIEGMLNCIKAANITTFTTINPAEKKQVYPLSSAQYRLFILQNLDKGNISYNHPQAVLLKGQVQEDLLHKTFAELVERHEILRSTFFLLGEKPVQKVHHRVKFRIKKLDCREENAREFIQALVQPFCLDEELPIRVFLIKLREDRHVLVVDIHHIATDGISMAILVQQMLALYHGQELKPINLQYRDYAVWHNSDSQKQKRKTQELFWLKLFEKETPVLNIPSDYPRPKIQSFAGDIIRFEMDAAITRALKHLTRDINGTLYMVLLAIFNVFLTKLCGQEDIVVGTPIAGRNHLDLESILGMFVGTLALRNQPSREKSFYDFLLDVKERTIQAFENQDYPFEELKDKVAYNKDSSRNPLFDVLFQFRNMDAIAEGIPEIEISGLKLQKFSMRDQTSKFDFYLFGHENAGSLHFSVEYCTKLYKAATIERFISYFKAIVQTIIQNRTIKIGDIKISTDLLSAKSNYLKDDTGDFYF